MPDISVVINCDTRSQKDTQGGLFAGVVNTDFLTDGIFNKKKFFNVFDIEIILFIDEHNPVDEKTLNYIRDICDVVCIRKHTDEHAFNDYNYLSALSLARGKYVCHFDQDVAAFTLSPEPIHQMIRLLEQYSFVSYPSHWSPRAVDDPSFGNRTWASTRFFICKKEAIKFDELRKMIEEPNWGYEKYGDSPRKCNWTEHFLSLMNNDSVYYPPIDYNSHMIFTWGRYEGCILQRLNNQAYEEVRDWVLMKGGIQYPVDVYC